MGMAVAAGDLDRKVLADINEQRREVVVWVATRHVGEADHTGHTPLAREVVISAQVRADNHRCEGEAHRHVDVPSEPLA